VWGENNPGSSDGNPESGNCNLELGDYHPKSCNCNPDSGNSNPVLLDVNMVFMILAEFCAPMEDVAVLVLGA
jgi:hypothetical protein